MPWQLGGNLLGCQAQPVATTPVADHATPADAGGTPPLSGATWRPAWMQRLCGYDALTGGFRRSSDIHVNSWSIYAVESGPFQDRTQSQPQSL